MLELVSASGPSSVPALSETLRVPHDAVQSAVDSLVRSGLLRVLAPHPKSSRDPQLYEAAEEPAYVVGIDLGGTKVAAAIADLNGRELAEMREPTNLDTGDALVRQIRRIAWSLAERAGVAWTRVRVLSIGVPGTVDPATDTIAVAFNIPDISHLGLTDALRAGDEHLSVVIDNDVNMAALGEQWTGRARLCRNFGFLSIGTGLGLGLVIDGHLCQGYKGATGEVAYLPLGGDPFDPANQHRGTLEERVSGRGLLRTLHELMPTHHQNGRAVPATVPQIFDAAQRGERLAQAVISAQARHIALAILAIHAVAGCELIVLGGGIGSHPLLLAPVREELSRLSSVPPTVETSALAHRAGLIGALFAGIARAKAVHGESAVLPPPADAA